MTEPSNLRDAAEVYEEFAPIVEDSIYLAEHEAVMASIKIGGWLSAALDDPAVCDAMKADIERWFSAGFLYLDEVRKLMQTEREALEAENETLRALQDDGNELLTIAWMDGAHRSNTAHREQVAALKAERIRGGEKVKEAAARETLMICLTNCEEWTDEAMEALNFAADRIRALSVPAIVEAGEHQPEEDSDG